MLETKEVEDKGKNIYPVQQMVYCIQHCLNLTFKGDSLIPL